MEYDYAEFKALDKITARINTLIIDLNSVSNLGTLTIKLRSCNTRPPNLSPDSAAYIEIYDSINNQSKDFELVFSGWMFSSSPAISSLEHPVYDISLISCKKSNVILQSESKLESISGN